jgi:DNA-binding response OmpR family regulator
MVDHSERSIALVVEDDPWIRLLLRDLLTDEGYTVLEASNGSAALRLAQRQPPALVLLDPVLPVWTRAICGGHRLRKRMRLKSPARTSFDP